MPFRTLYVKLCGWTVFCHVITKRIVSGFIYTPPRTLNIQLPSNLKERKQSSTQYLQTNTMREINQICYASVEGVVDTWQVVKRIPNYEEVAGEMLFRK